MNVSVGALAAASDGVGISPFPISGIGGAAAGVIGASGPFTQQHAGRSNNDSRTVETVVTMATGFQGTSRRTRLSLHEKCRVGRKRTAGHVLWIFQWPGRGENLEPLS